MRVIAIHEMGPSSRLVLEHRAPLQPTERQVLVNVKAFGMNRADLLQRDGRYPAPVGVVQDVPGLEFSGVVGSVGPDSVTYEVGERVMGIVAGGAYAEQVLTPETELLRIPEGMSFEDAASIPEAFMTAWDALVLQGKMKEGNHVLIHAAGSGVGLAAVQLCLALGAIPVGTSRTRTKLDKLSADFGLASVVRDDTWCDNLQSSFPSGFDLVLDLVGGEEMGKALHVLKTGGRVLVVGLTAGVRTKIRLDHLLRKRAMVKGTVLRSRSNEEKSELVSCFQERVLPLFTSGELRSLREERYSVHEIQTAHERMRENLTFGKLIGCWS